MLLAVGQKIGVWIGRFGEGLLGLWVGGAVLAALAGLAIGVYAVVTGQP